MKKKIIYILVVLLVVVLFSILFFQKKDTNELSTDTSMDTTTDIKMDINPDNGDEKIDWELYPNKDYELKSDIKITEKGTYHLTGTIEDGCITVDTSENVRLVLDNVSIKNSKGPAIYIKNAENVVIVTASNSKNYLEDGSSYTGYDSDVEGTIYSSDDITFDGEGILIVKSNLGDAIVGKDDLKIVNGSYEITSVDDGIRGKDSVYIKDGNFEIVSGGDAIKSTNENDDEKGFVLIENGTFSLNSTLDAIQAETKLLIQNGTFNITTGGGSSNNRLSEDEGRWKNNELKLNDSGNSAKGIKSGDNLVIKDGTFYIDSFDDAIHSNNYVGIAGGVFTISSGDDGIHADNEIIIDNGIIDISKSYEGIEADNIIINEGNIKVVSSDDGINVSGGNDFSAMNRPGENNYSGTSKNTLTIHGGTIYVNASGDGLDANGSIYMNGGYVHIDGPIDSGNGALDYDQEFVITGGTLLAGGSSGMVQGISTTSTVYNLLIQFESNYTNNDIITILDSSNKEIISYQSIKSYSSLVIASTQFEKDCTYKIQINGKDYQTFTITNITTTIGNSGNIGGTKRPNNMAPRPGRH